MSSGIHVAGIIQSRDCYEALSPKKFGRNHRFVLGKHSGLSGLRHELSSIGLELTGEEERRLLSTVRNHAERHKKPVHILTLARLAASLIGERAECLRAPASLTSDAPRHVLEALS